jgi:proline iminopeptidase
MMAKKRIRPGILLLFGLIGISLVSCRHTPGTGVPTNKETVLDRQAHLQDHVLWEIPAVPRWCERPELEKQRIDIGGCELYVEEGGKGTPIVLLHGGPGSTHYEFHPVFDRAAQFARTIYYDQRGCGQSDYRPEAAYTVAQAVSDLEKLREKLGIRRWVVLGHSYGGFLAQYYATLYPERVSGLVIVCGSTGLHDQALFESRQRDYISADERAAMRRFNEEIRKRAGEEGWTEERRIATEVYNSHVNGDWKRQSYYRPSMEEFAQTALYGWKNDIKNNFNRVMSSSENTVDLKGAFEDCPIPTLIVESVWDLTWNESKALLLAKNHPGAEMAVFTKSGHSPYKDEPELFFRTLERFLGSIRPVPDSSLAGYKASLERTRDRFDDPFLTAPLSDDETKAIARYLVLFDRIRGGEKYDDLKSPLDGLLSLYSACLNKDVNQARRSKSLYALGLERMPEWAQWVEEMEPWRVPQPPRDPEPGQVWPVYFKNRATGRWAETFLFQHWKGEWKNWGNMGGPYYDWRPSSVKMQRDFLVEKAKEIQ